jgi:hypothetical protein
MCSLPEDRVSPAVAKPWADAPSVQGLILRIVLALRRVNKEGGTDEIRRIVPRFNRMNWRWSSFQFVPRRSPLFVICYRQERRPGQFVDSSFRSSFLKKYFSFCSLQTQTPQINYLFFPVVAAAFPFAFSSP